MIRFLTAGESHGPELTAIVEGMPAGVAIRQSEVNRDLARRQISEGSGGRMSIETDSVRITGGVTAGHTTGAPISMVILNKDFASWRDRDIEPMTVPRPGHVDLNAAIKYGYSDLRFGLERASARETAARVAVGAICRRFLSVFGIEIGSYVMSIGRVKASLPQAPDYRELFATAEKNTVRCPDKSAATQMIAEIQAAKEKGDTLGGVFACVTLNVPPALGSHAHWDRRLGTRLLAAVGSIPAIKGVEIGEAFSNAAKFGTEVHDEIELVRSGALCRKTNRAGGLEGGISTGEPIVVHAAMKPISTTMAGLMSVNLATGSPQKNKYERSDVCAVPRAAVVAEGMTAFVIAEALIEKLGGDSISEMTPRFEQLRKSHISDLNIAGNKWRFDYQID